MMTSADTEPEGWFPAGVAERTRHVTEALLVERGCPTYPPHVLEAVMALLLESASASASASRDEVLAEVDDAIDVVMSGEGDDLIRSGHDPRCPNRYVPTPGTTCAFCRVIAEVRADYDEISAGVDPDDVAAMIAAQVATARGREFRLALDLAEMALTDARTSSSLVRVDWIRLTLTRLRAGTL